MSLSPGSRTKRLQGAFFSKPASRDMAFSPNLFSVILHYLLEKHLEDFGIYETWSMEKVQPRENREGQSSVFELFFSPVRLLVLTFRNIRESFNLTKHCWAFILKVDQFTPKKANRSQERDAKPTTPGGWQGCRNKLEGLIGLVSEFNQKSYSFMPYSPLLSNLSAKNILDFDSWKLRVDLVQVWNNRHES